MKSSIMIIAFLLLSFGLKAVTGGEGLNYVKTNSKVYFGQDLKFGLVNTKIISSDGTVTRIPNKEVTAYMTGSKLFEYLPVVCETNDTVCFQMMEYVTTRGGLNLYRCSCYAEKELKYQYFVFKDGKFHLRIDQKNAKTTLPFFGIKVV